MTVVAGTVGVEVTTVVVVSGVVVIVSTSVVSVFEVVITVDSGINVDGGIDAVIEELNSSLFSRVTTGVVCVVVLVVFSGFMGKVEVALLVVTVFGSGYRALLNEFTSYP